MTEDPSSEDPLEASPEASSLAAADSARVAQMAAILRQLRASLRYVDYRQAEEDCELLAAQILHEFSRAELADYCFVAIPRGGLIVLGMLSYLLDLEPEQLRPPRDAERPTFVIDDCSLSGARFAEHLERSASSEIVFAHLYSHPELRRAVMEHERIEACYAARDLADQIDSIYPLAADRDAWQRRWRQRLGPRRFWYGLPELVGFAWNEPDLPFWNPATERVESGWRLLPPQLCLKNRMRLVAPLERDFSQQAEWEMPAAVVSGTFDGVDWICRIDDERVFSLTDVAADMWRLLVGWGRVDAAAAAIVERYEVDADTARRDVAEFAEQLAAKGLLDHVEDF